MDFAHCLHPDPEPEAVLQALLHAPVLTRQLYPRGGLDGLEANALQVLVAVHIEGDQTVGALVELLALRQGTVSTALGRLQERGLVTELVDEADKRRRVQRITRDGRALIERLLAQATRRVAEQRGT